MPTQTANCLKIGRVQYQTIRTMLSVCDGQQLTRLFVPDTSNLDVRSPMITENQIELSIVMPCLNEAETLAVCINKAKQSLGRDNICGEIVIADNGSTDGSQQIALDLGARVANIEEKGYGSALMGGIVASRGKYIIIGDADDSYDFENIMPFVVSLRAGNDLVMGNRFKGGIKPGAMPPLHKYLGNPVLTGIGKLLFRSRCGDFHCGLRGFNRESILSLDLRTTGMEFASEMVVKSTLHGLKLDEVPTTLSPDGRSRPPHLRSWRDGWRHLRFLLMYSPKWLFFYPGILLMSMGLFVGTLLLSGPKRIGAITFDVHTLLFAAAAVVIGYQAITIGAFTKIFAISERLLPEDPKLNNAFKYITLESGLIAGALLTVGGIIGSLIAVGQWGQHSYGDLSPGVTLRFVIPSVTALMLGLETILASFFLSILGLRRK